MLFRVAEQRVKCAQTRERGTPSAPAEIKVTFLTIFPITEKLNADKIIRITENSLHMIKKMKNKGNFLFKHNTTNNPQDRNKADGF